MRLVSYLTSQRQCVKINDMLSLFEFKLIVLRVPQELILGPILFNISINDLFLLVSTDDIHNMITAFSETIQDLIHVLQNNNLESDQVDKK